MLGSCCCHWDLGTFAKCSCPLQGEGTEGALSFRLNSAPRVKGNLHFPCAPALLRGGSRGIHTSSWDWGAEGRGQQQKGLLWPPHTLPHHDPDTAKRLRNHSCDPGTLQSPTSRKQSRVFPTGLSPHCQPVQGRGELSPCQQGQREGAGPCCCLRHHPSLTRGIFQMRQHPCFRNNEL